MSVAGLKESILSAMAYDAAMIEVSTTPVQIVVTVVNSDLNAPLVLHSERNAEATQIVDAITRAFADSPDLAAVQAIHIDYASRESGSRRSKIVDSIDFRRNSQGSFELHKT